MPADAGRGDRAVGKRPSGEDQGDETERVDIYPAGGEEDEMEEKDGTEDKAGAQPIRHPLILLVVDDDGCGDYGSLGGGRRLAYGGSMIDDYWGDSIENDEYGGSLDG